MDDNRADNKFFDHLALRAKYSLHVSLTLKKAPAATCLTEREREVVELVCDCYSSKEIASILQLSVKTVDAHRSNIMRKLNIHDDKMLIHWAIRSGIVMP